MNAVIGRWIMAPSPSERVHHWSQLQLPALELLQPVRAAGPGDGAPLAAHPDTTPTCAPTDLLPCSSSPLLETRPRPRDHLMDVWNAHNYMCLQS